MRVFLACFCLLMLHACSRKNPYLELANALSHKFIIVDGHVDLPSRIKVQYFRFQKEYLGLPIDSKEGDFDFVRSKKGGLDAPFMSIYIPSALETPGAKMLADSLILMVEGIAAQNPAYYTMARTPAEVEEIFKSGKIALPMGMENGSPLDNTEDVAYYRNRGICYITLTHAKNNKICDSSYDTTRLWNGLSPFGERIVQEMNNQGVMVDVSHISDSSFYDVMRTCKVPVIASHSAARRFTPGFERNMSDDLIRKMKINGGVIMVNFGTSFLDGSISDTNRANEAALDNLLKRKGVSPESQEGKKLIHEFRQKSPYLYADVEKVADHIDHIVALAGIDHVGLGSDFDGVGDSLPKGLKDVADYPNLLASLLRRGYTEGDIEKICYKNIFRVWNKTLTYSKTYGNK
ncbi:MAG: dipeptidase [Saprospiraceae bacterium]|nr:dipeptidase [Saprospiraceae bacterium]